MNGSPECPVKIYHHREKRQQEEEKRENSQQSSTPFLPSPARLYSTVLQTMGLSCACRHEDTENADRSSIGTNRSIVINTH